MAIRNASPGDEEAGFCDDEEIGVLRRGQRLEVGGRFEAALGEPGDVVVDTDVTEVDRRRLVLGDEHGKLVG